MPGNPFGDELRRLRRQAKLSLADLADAIGCSITYISEVERGRKNPPRPTTIKQLLAAMGQDSRFQNMLVLAAKARHSVEISVEDKSEELTNVLVTLERRSDEGALTDETVRQIRKLLEKGRN